MHKTLGEILVGKTLMEAALRSVMVQFEAEFGVELNGYVEIRREPSNNQSQPLAGVRPIARVAASINYNRDGDND